MHHEHTESEALTGLHGRSSASPMNDSTLGQSSMASAQGHTGFPIDRNLSSFLSSLAT